MPATAPAGAPKLRAFPFLIWTRLNRSTKFLATTHAAPRLIRNQATDLPAASPVVMWDTKTLAVIKTIDVQGGPDGILFDPFNCARLGFQSQRAKRNNHQRRRRHHCRHAGSWAARPEQAVTDGKGNIYVDLEDKDQIAAVDAKALTVTAHWDISSKGEGPGGLGV